MIKINLVIILVFLTVVFVGIHVETRPTENDVNYNLAFQMHHNPTPRTGKENLPS